MDRESALSLLHEKMQNGNLRKHCYATEAVMRSLARYFGEDEDSWGLAGLLHDADYELTKGESSKHVVTVISWLRDSGTDSKIIQAINSHGWKYVPGCPEPSSKMDWSLYCCDELTGFIVGVALVKGKSLDNVNVDSVIKKFPEKKFCSGVNREQIKLCHEKLGIGIEEFIGISITAMKGIRNELGL